MKIREDGKEHADGDPRCTACDPPKGEHHPQFCAVNGCPGLRHVERFGNPRDGWEFDYRCDQCGETG